MMRLKYTKQTNLPLLCGHYKLLGDYRNDPKFSDRKVWANSADPDQTAPREQSDQGLHCLPFCLHLRDTFHKGKATLFNF